MIDLDEMLEGYIEAALWSTNDGSDKSGGVPFDDNYGPEDIAPATLEAMRKDCEAFIAKAGTLASEYAARRKFDTSKGSVSQFFGHDFWLNRNGHGTGFWDQEYLGADDDDLGKKLAALCGWQTDFPEVDLYLGDDGKIHT